MDVAAPDVSGLQALIRMKADQRTSNIPVILMSGYGDPDLEPEFRAMGAELCIDKQAHDTVIRNAVETVLA
jgi:CheY-like chemotaxis protein